MLIVLLNLCLRMIYNSHSGISLVVQWLRLRASNAEDMGSIPDRGTNIPQATQHSWNIKKNKFFFFYLETQIGLSNKTSVSSSPKWGNWTKLCLKSLPALLFYDWTHLKFTLPLQVPIILNFSSLLNRVSPTQHRTQELQSAVCSTEAVLSATPCNQSNLPLRQRCPNSLVLV